MDNTVSVAEFKKLLDRNRIEFIFDLRNEDEFAEWHIEGRSDVATVNIPQVDFVGEEEKYLATLPKDMPIVTVCAHGDSSLYTAELLKNSGFDAISLQGGMDSWSEFYEITRVNASPAVYQIYRVARGCLSYLIVSGGEAVVIDACRHTAPVLALAKHLEARITHVFDTHLHADHISGGKALAEAVDAHYCIHPADMSEAKFNFIRISDRQVISFGNSSVKVLHSAGHTPGSTSFLVDGKFLFSGDTIMKRSIGRPDLGGKADAWAMLLYDTLFSRFAGLPDELTIYPSHTTSIREQNPGNGITLKLGDARKEQELFRLRDAAAFVACVKANLPNNPERYQQIRLVNLGILEADEAKQKELEIGKNLCGMTRK